jgi:hypothetical protein
LGIANYNPGIIGWVSFIPRGRGTVEMPFDEVILSSSQIMLPAAMRDKLEPEEWKPILASALINSKNLRRKAIEQVSTALAVLVGISITLILTLPILLPTPVRSCSNGGVCTYAPEGFMIGLIVGLFLPLGATPILGVILTRRLSYLADREAADLVGTAYFFGVLNKIANIAGGQVMARKRVGGPLSPFPSLGSRIINLQDYTGQS